MQSYFCGVVMFCVVGCLQIWYGKLPFNIELDDNHVSMLCVL